MHRCFCVNFSDSLDYDDDDSVVCILCLKKLYKIIVVHYVGLWGMFKRCNRQRFKSVISLLNSFSTFVRKANYCCKKGLRIENMVIEEYWYYCMIFTVSPWKAVNFGMLRVRCLTHDMLTCQLNWNTYPGFLSHKKFSTRTFLRCLKTAGWG